MFGEDIGEDYFGFKNLGLDQEYNLESLQVHNPNYLNIHAKVLHYRFQTDCGLVKIKTSHRSRKT